MHNGCRRAIFQLPQNLAENLEIGPEVNAQLVESALNARANTLRFTPTQDTIDLTSFFNIGCSRAIQGALRHVLSPMVRARVCFHLKVSMAREVKVSADSDETRLEEIEPFFASKLMFFDNAEEELNDEAWQQTHIAILDRFTKLIENFQMRGSNWRLQRIIFLDIFIGVFRRIVEPELMHGGGNDRRGFKIPLAITTKKAIINITPSSGIQCFRYAMLGSLYHQDVVGKPTLKKLYIRLVAEVNLFKIPEPVMLDKNIFACVAKNNPGIGLRIFQWNHETKSATLFYERKPPSIRCADILFIPPYDEYRYGHYVPIKSVQRLLSSHRNQRLFCPNCLFNTHINGSMQHNCPGTNKTEKGVYVSKAGQEEMMPKTDDEAQMRFRSYQFTLPLPYVVYADSETYCEPVQDERFLNHHKVAAIGYCLVHHESMREFHSLETPCRTIFSTETTCCVEVFLEELKQLCFTLYEERRRCTDLPPNALPTRPPPSACEQCGNKFKDASDCCADHDHLSGEQRQWLCQKCNLQLCQTRQRLVVYFHNFKHFDGKLLLKKLPKVFGDQIFVLPETREAFKCINVKIPLVREANQKRSSMFELCFRDTFAYMASSLSSLASLLDSKTDLIQTRKLLGVYPQLKESTLLAKGVYPYSWLTQLELLDSTCELPPREAFFDNISLKPCSEQDYQRAEMAWQEFGCRTMRDYTRAYLELDILLLADVFENFRRIALSSHHLDPAHYLGAPSFTMAAFLYSLSKSAGPTHIELTKDVTIYREAERSIRGGFTQGCMHLVQANNPVANKLLERRPEDNAYSPDNTYLALLDANSLYPTAMIRPMPVGNMRWMDPHLVEHLPYDAPTEKIEENVDPRSVFYPSLEDISTPSRLLTWIKTHLTSEKVGAFFTVDLYYPRSLHDRTSDFPLAVSPEKTLEQDLTAQMREDWLLTQRRIDPVRNANAQRYEDVKSYKPVVPKLLGTCWHKSEYTVHVSALIFYLEMGMKVTKVHRVLLFDQYPFLRDYVNRNIQLRREATSPIVSAYYKILSNALYGKFLENLRSRFKIMMCTTEKKVEKYLRDSRLVDMLIYGKDLVGAHIRPSEVKLCNPITVGAAVLDVSKEIMYRFFYDNVQYHHSLQCARVLGGDTDSLMLALTMKSAEDSPYTTLFPDLARMGLLDTSNYPKDHPLYSTQLAGVLGAFKDEFAGKYILELVFLRPKSYSFLFADSDVQIEQRARCKGVSRQVVRSTLNHDRYRQCIHNREVLYTSSRRLASRYQEIFLMEERKLSLGFFETKRAWYNRNESLPFGHYRLLENS
jgi:hypothetical protein